MEYQQIFNFKQQQKSLNLKNLNKQKRKVDRDHYNLELYTERFLWLFGSTRRSKSIICFSFFLFYLKYIYVYVDYKFTIVYKLL